MYGYRMSSSEEEQYYLRQLFADAIERRAPVEVTFFRSKEIVFKYVENGVTYEKRYRGYVPTTRLVEPYSFHVSKAGGRSVKVVDRAPEGAGSQPQYRSIRLDRVAVNTLTGKPFAVRRLTLGYLCPSLLDRKPLHPTKGVLAA